jgi:hypothetical protein
MRPGKRKRAPEGDADLAQRIALREGDAVQEFAEQKRLLDAAARRFKRLKRQQSRPPTFKVDQDTVQGLKYFANLIRAMVGHDTPADAGGRRKRFPWTLSVAAAKKLFTPLSKAGLCQATFTEVSGRVTFSCLNAVVAAFGEPAGFYARCSASMSRLFPHPPPGLMMSLRLLTSLNRPPLSSAPGRYAGLFLCVRLTDRLLLSVSIATRLLGPKTHGVSSLAWPAAQC